MTRCERSRCTGDATRSTLVSVGVDVDVDAKVDAGAALALSSTDADSVSIATACTSFGCARQTFTSGATCTCSSGVEIKGIYYHDAIYVCNRILTN